MYVMQMSPYAGPFASVDLLSIKLETDLKKKKNHDVDSTVAEQHRPNCSSDDPLSSGSGAPVKDREKHRLLWQCGLHLSLSDPVLTALL